MIIFLLEKVTRCAQMSADCLRASKLVNLGYIYFSYIPTQTSVYYALHPRSYLNVLSVDIRKYASLGKVSLISDVNSRCRNWSDVLPLHNAFDRYINVIETDDSSRGRTSLPERRTLDTVTISSGHKLLKSCLSSDVRIINGRINDIGQCTYVSINCNSFMDYVLVSDDLFPFINNFTVQDMHSFSPHLTISVEFKLNYITSQKKA